MNMQTVKPRARAERHGDLLFWTVMHPSDIRTWSRYPHDIAARILKTELREQIKPRK